MKIKTSGILFFLIFIMQCSTEQDYNQELQRLANAERAFAGLAKSSGIREAFLTYLSDDAIVFRPRPQNGREAYKTSPTKPGMLQWQPVYNAISRDCDLGFSTGPWEWRPNGTEEVPTIYGHFVSVWEKNENQNWQVIFDAGVGYPGPSPEHNLVSLTSVKPVAPAGKIQEHAIVDLDNQFSQKIIHSGYISALQSFANESTRFYQKQAPPITGLSALLKDLGDKKRSWQFNPIHTEIATSTDLGYSCGFIAENDIEEKYSYLHIYRKDADGQWQLAVDLVLRIPAD